MLIVAIMRCILNRWYVVNHIERHANHLSLFNKHALSCCIISGFRENMLPDAFHKVNRSANRFQ